MQAQFSTRQDGYLAAGRSRLNGSHFTVRDVKQYKQLLVASLARPGATAERRSTACHAFANETQRDAFGRGIQPYTPSPPKQYDYTYTSVRTNSITELRSKLSPDHSRAASRLLATEQADLEAAVPHLVDILYSDNERIKLLAVEAVRDMACTPSLQLRLAESGAVEAVADLLRPPSYDVFWLQTISKVAAEALAALCNGQSSIKTLTADAGAIPHLVELAGIYQTIPIGRNFDVVHRLEDAGLAAARVLCSLADVGSLRPQLSALGAITVLHRMLDHDDNTAVAHKYAALALAKLSVGC